MAVGFAGFVCTSAAIDDAISRRAMLSHPFYQAWEQGQLSSDMLRTYAMQYFHHVEAFPRAVSAVHSNCPDARGRRLLAENLAEEEGLGEGKDVHAKLWLDFAQGMGAHEADARAATLNPETQALVEAFRTLSRRSYAAGLGALYAYESQLPGVSRTKIAGLIARYGVKDEDTLRFFRVHEAADIEHSDACRELLDELEGKDRDEALAGATALSEALLGFLSGMQRQTGLH